MSAPFLIVADMNDSAGAVIAILLAMAPAIGILFYVARRTRLVLDQTGLAYYNVGVSATLDWDKVDKLLISTELCGLVLKNPLDQAGMRRLQRISGMAIGGNSFYTEKQQKLIREKRFIDLRAYRRQLRDQDMQRTFRAYKPDLVIENNNATRSSIS
ncbi:MAG: hypothetical protein AAF385_05120 [Pseudomonadota bacterium]